MNRTVVIIIAVVAALYVFASSVFVVNEREQAIVTRFGEISRVITEPGLNFKVPTDFVESVQILEKRVLRYDLEDIRVQVSGGRFYNVDAFLTYVIENPRLFREQTRGSITVAEGLIDSRFESALRRVYGLREFGAALSEERAEMMQQAQQLISDEIAELGIRVVDVRILRTDLTAEVSQQTYDRMSAERLAEAARLRAAGREQAQTIRAQADRRAVEILAAARRDSEILRGEGDADRNNIFARSYSIDPEFFQFYRAMQSYRTALQEGGTTLVLSPDSEFFQYFRSDTVGNVPVPDPTGLDELPRFELQEEPQEVREEDLVTPESPMVPSEAEPAGTTPEPAASGN